MFISIVSVIFGLGLFIVPLWAYRRGLQDGLALSKGRPIEPLKLPTIQNPEKPIPDAVSEGIANIFAYDGTPQDERE